MYLQKPRARDKIFSSFFIRKISGGNMEQEEIINRIERTEEILKEGIGEDIMTYLLVLDMLRKDCEDVRRIKRSKEVSKEIINLIEEKKIEGDNEKLNLILRNAYDTLARNGNFEAFMIAMEWNRPIKNQFYLPRKRVLRKHGFIQEIQNLLDRKIKMLVLEAPPGIGKSVLRRVCFLLSICNESK